MGNIYKIMFAVGVLYTFVSFILNGISGAFHLGGHAGHLGGHGGDLGGHGGDLGGHGHLGGHGDIGGAHGHVGTHAGADVGGANGHGVHSDAQAGGTSGSMLSYLSILINPIVAVSFLAVFGGIGIMGTEYFKWAALNVLLIALISGIVTAFILYKYVSVPLYRSENSTHVSREDLISAPAEVISSVLENGYGEISYTVNDIRYTAPARHIDGKSVKQGVKVVICKIENNTFFVSEVKEL